MRSTALFRLLFVPAALFAIACDDSRSPLEPPEADEATPPAREVAASPEAAALWADGYLVTTTSATGAPQPYPIYSYNRSGGPMTVTKVAGTTGRYRVRFAGLSALVGTKNTVHVTAYGTDGAYCKPAGARLAADTIQVRCFVTGTGVAMNSMFSVLVAGQREERAFAFANQPTGSNYSPAAAGSWNPAGATSIYRWATGYYQVAFRGLATRLGANVGGHVQVNAVGTGKAHCKVVEWGAFIADMDVYVACYTPGGAPVDSKFSTLFVLPAPLMGYAWANQPSAASYVAHSVYSWNPAGGGVSITRQGTGVYGLTWDPQPFNGYGTVQVTAYGEDAAQCKVTVLGIRSAGVRCFGANGLPADAYYTVLLHN